MNSRRLNTKVAVLATTILLIAAVGAIIACAPAAPGGGGDTPGATQPPGEEKPTATIAPTLPIVVGGPAPTLAGTPAMIYLHNPEGTLVPVEKPPERTYEPEGIVVPELKRLLRKYEESSQRRDSQPVEELEKVKINVRTNTEADAERVLALLKEAGGTGSYIKGTLVAITLRIDRLAAVISRLEATEGVKRINMPNKLRPAGAGSTTGEPSPDIYGITAWHTAGITGAGVQVGIIDTHFTGFARDIQPMLQSPVQAFCLDDDEEPTNNLADCDPASANPTTADRTPMPSSHGTEVARALLEIAPHVIM